MPAQVQINRSVQHNSFFKTMIRIAQPVCSCVCFVCFRIVLICAKRSLCAAFSVLPYGESFYLRYPPTHSHTHTHRDKTIACLETHSCQIYFFSSHSLLILLHPSKEKQWQMWGPCQTHLWWITSEPSSATQSAGIRQPSGRNMKKMLWCGCAVMRLLRAACMAGCSVCSQGADRGRLRGSEAGLQDERLHLQCKLLSQEMHPGSLHQPYVQKKKKTTCWSSMIFQCCLQMGLCYDISI